MYTVFKYVHVADKPQAPQSLTAICASEREICVSWSEPLDDGGCNVSGYLVEIRESSRRTWRRADYIQATSDCRFTALGLKQGESYMLRVAAENEVGMSDFVELSEAVTASLKFGMWLHLFGIYCKRNVWVDN